MFVNYIDWIKVIKRIGFSFNVLTLLQIIKKHKLQHWTYGEQIFMFGLIANFVLSVNEISRLRKIILKSENEKSESVCFTKHLYNNCVFTY